MSNILNFKIYKFGDKNAKQASIEIDPDILSKIKEMNLELDIYIYDNSIPTATMFLFNKDEEISINFDPRIKEHFILVLNRILNKTYRKDQSALKISGGEESSEVSSEETPDLVLDK